MHCSSNNYRALLRIGPLSGLKTELRLMDLDLRERNSSYLKQQLLSCVNLKAKEVSQEYIVNSRVVRSFSAMTFSPVSVSMERNLGSTGG